MVSNHGPWTVRLCLGSFVRDLSQTHTKYTLREGWLVGIVLLNGRSSESKKLFSPDYYHYWTKSFLTNWRLLSCVLICTRSVRSTCWERGLLFSSLSSMSTPSRRGVIESLSPRRERVEGEVVGTRKPNTVRPVRPVEYKDSTGGVGVR